MDAVHDLAPQQGAGRLMLVMLPGVKDRAQDFVQHGFIQAIRERGWPVDVAAADAHMGYYLGHNVVERLEEDVIAPARAANHRRIWLMGISLGGLGALSYARAHAGAIEGVILLAPYLGARGTIAGIVRAGGLARWQPGEIAPDDEESLLLDWIKSYRPGDPALPAVFLGYGREDRFAAASTLLAELLPASHVVSIEGAHDWAAWVRLWDLLLDRDPFGLAAEHALEPAAMQSGQGPA
jgi:pimeloyl-ACP methyl ester carboxylesterase